MPLSGSFHCARRRVGDVGKKHRRGAVELTHSRREQVGGGKELTVHVELGLLPGAVADADRPTIRVALQMRELVLEQQSPASNAVHDLQRTRRRDRSAGRRREESEELRRFVRTGRDPQRLEREARVAHPAIPIVPVAIAAGHFGERRRWRGDDRRPRVRR